MAVDVGCVHMRTDTTDLFKTSAVLGQLILFSAYAAPDYKMVALNVSVFVFQSWLLRMISVLCPMLIKRSLNIQNGINGNLMYVLLEVHVMRPLPSPKQVQSTTIQPW